MTDTLETMAIHAGKVADTSFNSVMPPLYASSTFAFDRLGENKGFDYTRSGNPTRQALEDCIAALEGGVRPKADRHRAWWLLPPIQLQRPHPS